MRTMVEKYLGKTDSEKTTILTDTKKLLKSVDVVDNAEEQIGNFFNALNTYEENDKLQLLHDVLQEGEISIGTGGTKKLKEVADDFSEYVEQEGSTRKIKAKGLPEDGSKTYVEQFLNQGNSSLAYLIQKTANFIKVQAQRGYGNQADLLDNIAEDKKFGNQTRRALEGLKSWIESSNSLTFDENKTYTEEDIKGMKFISKKFLEALKEKNADVFGKFWKENDDGTFSPAEGKEFAQNWSNNYAIDFGTDDSSTTTTRTETPETANGAENLEFTANTLSELQPSLDELKQQEDISSLKTLTLTFNNQTAIFNFKGDNTSKKEALNAITIKDFFNEEEENENEEEEENTPESTTTQYEFIENERQEKEGKGEKMEKMVDELYNLLDNDMGEWGQSSFDYLKPLKYKNQKIGDINIKRKGNTFTFSVDKNSEIFRTTTLTGGLKTYSLENINLEQAKKIALLINFIGHFTNEKETGTDNAGDIDWNDFGIKSIFAGNDDNNPFYIDGRMWWNGNLMFGDAGSLNDYDIISSENLKKLGILNSKEFAKFLTTVCNYKFD